MTDKPVFDIGRELWWARFETTENSVECPDCGGTGRLRVTFHDETTVSVGCQNCDRGYESPNGRVIVHDRQATAELVTISGVDLRQGQRPEYRARYEFNSSWVIDEARLFLTKPGAMECAKLLAAEADLEERERVQKKEKDTESWAWNAAYHRKVIARAKKDIAYHESKLTVASLKAKS